MGAETLIIISHGLGQEKYFSANAFPTPQGDLSQFGLLAAQKKFNTDLLLLDKIRQTITTPFQLLSSKTLDYATAITLKLLTDERPVKILVFVASNLSVSDHLNFGRELGMILRSQSANIS